MDSDESYHSESEFYYPNEEDKENNAEETPSSETQGLLVGTMWYFGAKVYFKSWRAPGILLLTDQFRSQLKSLSVIGHKNIFVPNQSPAIFVLLSWLLIRRCPLQTVRSPVRHTCPPRAGEFPSIEKCHWKENHETEKISKFSMFVNPPEKVSNRENQTVE